MRAIRILFSLGVLAGAIHQFVALLSLSPTDPADTFVTRLLMFGAFLLLGIHGATPLFDHGAFRTGPIPRLRLVPLTVLLVGIAVYLVRFADAPARVHRFASVHLVVAVLYSAYFAILIGGDILLGPARRFLRGTRA